MEGALFDPESGYYSRHIQSVGRDGDFSTSATLSRGLGQAIAQWIRAELEAHGDAAPTHVIEVGPGDGSLMNSVIHELGWKQRWLGGLRFHLVETSPVLAKRQREKLKGKRSIAGWYGTVQEALETAGGSALIYSNELVDAFPATLLEFDGAAWREVFVAENQATGRVVESLASAPVDPDSLPPLSALAEPWPIEPTAGHRIEIHPSYHEWLEEWLPNFQSGSTLTIDYGDTFPDIYSRRRAGSLRAYLRHQRITGPDLYLNCGRQDITADVNFSDIKNWGERLGMETTELESQRDFILRQVPELGRRAMKDPALKMILNPDGAGEAFRVLSQRLR